MNYICVYCGSNMGRSDVYASAARSLAKSLVERKLGLIYGGARVGLMGVLADEVLDAGGKAIGVIPESLILHEIAHDNLTALHVTKTMHERKKLMAQLADGFIALPGGMGTLDEIFEVLTWGQLSFHSKPIGLLNTAGYFDHLNAFLDHTVDEQFVRAPHRSMLFVEESPDTLLDYFASYQAPDVRKWVEQS